MLLARGIGFLNGDFIRQVIAYNDFTLFRVRQVQVRVKNHLVTLKLKILIQI